MPKKTQDMTTCDFGADPSQQAFDCERYEQCDDCYAKDHPEEE